MGWGWPFSSASPAPAPSRQTDATTQDYQLELMRLEKERLDLMIKLKQAEAARQASSATSRPATIAQRALSAPAPAPAPVHTTTTTPASPLTREEPWRRSAKQLGLFFAGATFLTASVFISRRAVNRKMIASYPQLFQPSHHGPKPPPRGPKEKGDDQLVAVEALGLATLNVMSFGVMATGGLMFAFDISNVEELRQKARSSLYGPNGVVDEAAEQQVEDWIVDVLARRDGNDSSENDQKKDG